MKLKITSWILVLLALGIGSLVIFGWITHTPLLIQILPNLVPMQFNTALLMIASSLGLVCFLLNLRILGCIIGLTVATFATLTLLQYILGVDFAIDELFYNHYITTKSSHSGRMAPNSAICYIFLGLGALGLNLNFKADFNSKFLPPPF